MTPSQTKTPQDYDKQGRARALEAIREQLGQFELSPVNRARVVAALDTLDLLAAAAHDAYQPDYIDQNPKPPYDLVKLHQRNWGVAFADELRLAYDLLREIAAGMSK